LAPATAAQLDLAGRLGLTVPADAPGLLVAAMLRDALGPTIDAAPKPASAEQLEYLDDLSAWTTPEDPQPSTHAIASALLTMLETRRALECLEVLQLRAGDIVVEWRRSDRRTDDEVDPQRLRLVASIADDGTVYFQSGGGRRARVHRLNVVHRADDDSDEAQKAHDHAQAEARRHADVVRRTGALNSVKVNRLRRWSVAERPILPKDVDEFRGVIETAKDEKPIQLYLQDRPHLLTGVLIGGHGRWLRPQTRFGGRYVADFLIAEADSIGIRWTLIELESPRARPLSEKGEWLKEARHAQHQIRSWRHYIAENLDAARKDVQDEGLGLVDIDPGVPGLILISRRSIVGDDHGWMRRGLRLDSGIEMHTYDWLLDRVEATSQGRRVPFHSPPRIEPPQPRILG
jgi:Domain of unknown function (DUF4263)